MSGVSPEKEIAMSSEQQFRSSNKGRPPRNGAEPPSCPQCQRRMTVKLIAPVLFASGLDDVTYECEGCHTGAKRTIRRST